MGDTRFSSNAAAYLNVAAFDCEWVSAAARNVSWLSTPRTPFTILNIQRYLYQVNANLAAFAAEMKAQGRWNNTVVGIKMHTRDDARYVLDYLHDHFQ